MKYKIARKLIDKIKTFDVIDGDLLVFKKPYTRTFVFKFKNGKMKEVDMKDCRYISLSNHGFLFIMPDSVVSVHLNNVDDFLVK